MKKFPFTEVASDPCLPAKLRISVRCPAFTCYVSMKFFFLESRAVGTECDGLVRTPPPTGCGGPFYTGPDTSHLKTKINSSIQFLPGEPHFLAHSSNFIPRHCIHLTVLFVKM